MKNSAAISPPPAGGVRGGVAGKPKLLLLSRSGCHLCEEFRAELEAVFPGRFELREACVDDEPDWRARYGLKIPVLLAADGSLICDSHFDREKIARHLVRKLEDLKSA